MNNPLASPLRLFVVLLLGLAAFGCKTEEEKANEEAVKSRDAQAAQMGHTGAASGPGKAAPGAAPSSGGQ